MTSLVVVDDSQSTLLIFKRLYQDGSVKVYTAENAKSGLDVVRQIRPDVVILDIMLPDMSGLEMFERVRQIDAKLPVIFITASSSSETVIEAMKLGAFDYLSKPLNLGTVRDLVQRALEMRRLMAVPVRVTENVPSPSTPVPERPEPAADALVGRCQGMQDVYKAIGLVAPQDVTVLVLGETGTGKELIARAIYQHGRRAGKPFLAINCAAIPETLLESELFGHERGAFTGADRRRIGKFEQAHGGTLFLDEIGDMTPLTQSKLLRVLQEQRFERLGGEETVHTDVRVIAATNRNLETMVAEEKFRGDLYYRLNVFTIRLPPLRDRGSDVDSLVDHYVRRYSKEFHKENVEIPQDVRDLLRAYPWPGNIRELQGVVKQALLRSTGSVLMKEALPKSVQTGQARNVGVGIGGSTGDESSGMNLFGAGNGSTAPAPTAAAARPEATSSRDDWEELVDKRIAEGSENLYDEWLHHVERRFLVQVLRKTEGNQLRAAKVLGITRTTLRNKLRQLGISIDREIDAAT